MRAWLFAALMTATATTVAAEPLTIARLFADPALSGAAPRSLKISPDGARVTFLRGRADDQNQLDLWEFHLASGKTRVLVDSALLAPQAAALSDEEKARRERARLANFSGIVEYAYAPDGKRLLFPLNGELYVYDLAKKGADALAKLTDADDGFATDPKVSPRGRYVSFVRDQDLWVIELDGRKAYAVTAGGGGTVSNGVAEFVAQEEMDRHTGYWWAPDDSKIAYARIDEADVPVQKRFEIYADRTDVIQQRYPAAGDPNVAISLHYVVLDEVRDAKRRPNAAEMEEGESFSVDPATGRALISHRIDLGEVADIYLARVDWIDAERLAFQRQSRDQRTLELVRVDLDDDGAQTTLLTETSDTWVNLHDDFRPLARPQGFLWSSERSGLRQLYLYDEDGELMRQVSSTDWPIDEVLAVDERTATAFVEAPGPDPLEKHVYAYPLAGGAPKKLTKEGGFHEAEFSGDGSVFVATHSDPSTPPQVRLFRADGRLVTTLEANALESLHPYAPYLPAHRTPTYGTLASKDGQTLHYGYITPPGFDATKRHPVIVRYYGGPGRQFVTKSWTVGVNTGLTDLLSQHWAQQGYVVFALDNRGTPRRGKKFEDALFKTAGDDEVDDTLAGVDWLVSQPWVDGARIGGFGWSYGGYQTLMLLAKASDRFAAGVAVAPVTDWRLYDTHYTERYLDRPSANAAGYDASSVLTYLDGLKSPLLLMHGMADDNVLFTHSTRLMAELQARAQPFELMTYPGGKHALVGAPVRTHVYATIDAFFARTLKPGT